MINTTAEYALRAVVFLAANDAQPISRADLADRAQIPVDYLVKVMRMLDEAGLVQSQRGPGGGYRFCGAADQVSVYDVVSAVAELPRIAKCPLGLKEHVTLCPLHARLDEVAELAEKALRETRITELIPANSKRRGCDFPTAEEE